MKDEYIIINKTAIQKIIEKLNKEIIGSISNEQKMLLTHELDILKIILSQSTPLIPEIEKAIDFGKDYMKEHSYIAEDWNNTPIIEYHDSTEEINKYISNLKLDI